MPLKTLASLWPKSNLRWRKYLFTGLAWLFVITVAVAPRIFDLDVFYGRDELTIWSWVDEFIVAVRDGDMAGTLTASDYPGIPMFWAQTLFLTVKDTFPSLFKETSLPLNLLTEGRSLELLAERRLVVALYVSLQIAIAVWMIRRLFGWQVALLSAIFMGLDPFSLTEARVLRLEMISASFVALSVLSYFFYLRWRGHKWLLISGVMAGLGASSKTSAGLIVPYIWLLLLLDFLIEPDQSWLDKFKQMIGNGFTWAVGAIAAFWLIWPAMWVRPVEAANHIFWKGLSQATHNSVWHGPVFFRGQLIPDDPGPYFYPVVFAFRSTPLAWIGIAAALFMGGVVFWQRATGKPVRNLQQQAAVSNATKIQRPTLWGLPWSAMSTLLLLACIILVAAELTFVISKVDRFLLIVFPFLNILSAIGIAVLIDWLARQFCDSSSPIRPWFSIGATCLILGIQLRLTLPAHPYYFTYWNPWLGGAPAAVKTLPVGSGEGLDLAMDYLNSQSNPTELSVVCGASEPWCEGKFIGQTYRSATYASGEWAAADYISFYISQLQRQEYPEEIVDFFMSQTPSYRAELQGATYAWVYAVPQIDHFAGAWNDLAGLGRLLGYNLSPAGAGGVNGKVGDTVEVTVWWSNLGAGVDNLVVRWIDETGYEWGRTRVIPQPEYASIAPDEQAIVSGRASFTIPPGTPPGLYFLRLGVTAPGEDRLLGEFKLPDQADQLVLVPGTILTDPQRFAISNPVNRPMSSAVTLLGYTPPRQVLSSNAPSWLTLYWQATAQVADYVVVLRLLDSHGKEVAAWQGKPGHGHYPIDQWQPGEIVRDVWALQVQPETPIGRYRLTISLLNSDGSRPEIPGQETVAELEIENIEVWSQPITYKVPEMQSALNSNFGDRLTLLGYDLFFDADNANGGSLSPTFYWQSRMDLQKAFDLLITLRSADTHQAVKEWLVSLGATEPKFYWKANEVITTIYQLETGIVSGGRYHLDITLQDQATGQAEPVQLNDGTETTFVRIEDIQDKVRVRVVER